MASRFRGTFKLFPGVRFNLGKSGITTSIGKPGATLNIGGKRGPRATVGIPGTGVSYSERLGGHSEHASPTTGNTPTGSGLVRALMWVVLLLVLLAALRFT